ncbi:hypothetical protein CF328_g8880 [Tilletia controversa]|nr:hypothetical protein CF328_g8880 [Tilletia controversa]KAE8181594.1 hypothetical protein CF335_g8881 [Tilletia laevis]
MHPIRAGLAQPRQPFKKTDSDIGLRSLFDCMLCATVSSPFRETAALSCDLSTSSTVSTPILTSAQIASDINYHRDFQD